MREYFTLLGAFAPKPAKFDINAMSVLWQIENPKHIAYHLVSRGLLEAIDENFFQMHALLAMHARSLIND
jgi:hypothetical protein